MLTAKQSGMFDGIINSLLTVGVAHFTDVNGDDIVDNILYIDQYGEFDPYEERDLLEPALESESWNS